MKSAVLVAVLITLSVVGCTKRQGSDLRSGTLTVLATESHLPLVQQLAADYHSIYPGVVLTVSGTSTRGAIVDMVNDSVQCIIVDRHLNDEERRAGESAKRRIVETEIAHDGLAILVQSQNKIQAVSMEELRSVLSGDLSLWSKLPESKLNGLIELCLTGRNSGLYELLTRTFFKLPKDIPVLSVAPSQNNVIEFVATHPEGLGIISYATWKDTSGSADQHWKKSVRVLDILVQDTSGAFTPVKVHQRNIYDEVYPLTYSLYIYTSEITPGTAQGFSAFVAGEIGQRDFLYAGLVPKTMPYRSIQLTQE